LYEIGLTKSGIGCNFGVKKAWKKSIIGHLVRLVDFDGSKARITVVLAPDRRGRFPGHP
jgi:hypothetical protein